MRHAKKRDRSLIDQHLSTSCFYENIRRGNFCAHKILTEGVFEPQCLVMRESQFDKLCSLRQIAFFIKNIYDT